MRKGYETYVYIGNKMGGITFVGKQPDIMSGELCVFNEGWQ